MIHLKKGNYDIAALLYGLLTHLRIYPIIYALTFYLFLSQNRSLVNMRSIRFGLLSGGLFILLFLVFYKLYGMEFAYETYFYHLVRKDPRHNISIYWLANWFNSKEMNWWVHMAMSLSHKLVFILPGFLLYKDFELAIFVQTFAFVMYNSVSNQQYVLWYGKFFIFLCSDRIYYTTKLGIFYMISCIVFFVATWLSWELEARAYKFYGRVNSLEKMGLINIIYFVGIMGFFYITMYFRIKSNTERCNFKI